MTRSARPTASGIPRATSTAFAVALALSASACSDGAAPTGPTWSEPLLARGTAELVVDVREYRPALADGFGIYSLEGWHEAGGEWQGKTAAATFHGTGILGLSAGPPADRRVVVEACRGGGTWRREGPADLHAVLRGERFHLGRLTADWQEFSFDAPRALWTEGQNRLVLEVEQEQGAFERDLLQVARVQMLPAGGADSEDAVGAAAELADDGLSLGPGEALRVQLAGIDGGAVAIDLAAEAEGELLVALAEIDPWTSFLLPDALDSVLYVEPGTDGPLRIELPADAPALARLELRWQPSDERSPIRLRSVDLERRGAAPPPLVIFLSVDTLAALNMSLYGYERPTTPELERLAQHAAVFERCSANAPWTLPSYVSQLSALLPTSHEPMNPEGLTDASVWSRFTLASERLTLAELLNAAGYETRAIVDNPFLAQLRGVRQGFEQLDVRPSKRGHRDLAGGMELISSTTLDWIDEWDRERPLFLFMQVLDVHGPYLTTAPWAGTFNSDAARGPLLPIDESLGGAYGAVPSSIAAGARERGFERDDVAPVGALVDAYDEKILEMDARIGEFLAALEERGLRDDLLLVISADHGESTVQRGQYFRHGPVYEPSVHVPLLFDLPGRQAGRRIPDRVQLVDLMPTLAELVELDPSPFSFHGRSLAPLLRGESLNRRPVAIQATHREQRAILVDDWKLIVSNPGIFTDLAMVLTYDRFWDPWAASFPDLARELAGRSDLSDPPIYDAERFETFVTRHPQIVDETRTFFQARGKVIELYDLATDPDELLDRSAEEPEVVAELTAALDFVENLAIKGRSYASAGEVIDELSPEILAELAALGYLDVGARPAASDREPAESSADGD